MRNLFVFCMVLGLCGGCGGSTNRMPPDAPPLHKAEGTITYQGAPLDGAMVVFVPDSGNIAGSAQSNSEGKFSIQAFAPHEGVPAGRYRVTIKKTESVPAESGDGESARTVTKHLIPERYGKLTSSGFTAEVPEGGTADLHYELTD